MVDYNIGIPQQQLFQSPDVMQNAMRMQQMQAQNAQMQELARQRSEEEALRGIRVNPNSPEYIQQLQRINPRLVFPALTAQRQNIAADRAAEASARQIEKSNVDISAARLDLIRKFSADLPGVLTSADPAAAYGAWRARIKQVTGQEPGVPEVYPGAKALRGIMDTTEGFLTRTAPQPREFAGALGQLDPETNTFNEAGFNRFTPSADTGAGAGTGPAMVPLSPNKAAELRATQARVGETVTPFNAAGANVAVNNMPVVPVAPAVGARVNNMPGAPAPEAGAKNAMRAGPVSSGDFARAQKAEEDARALVLAEERTAAMERGKATEKEKTETKARKETAGRVLQALNNPEIDNLIKNSTSGALEYGLAATKGAVTGTATPGMENIGRLAAIQDALLFRLANGKLGGGFTDKDTDIIRNMLGRIADPNTASNVRIKTLQDVRAMMNSVATGENMVIAPASVVEEPKPSARRRATLDGVSGGGQARGNAVTNGVDTNNPLLR
jgi:hypothetical protein